MRGLVVSSGKLWSKFAAHNLVAFACRFFEPRSVNLDQAPPSRSDSARRPELGHNQRHCRSSYPEQLRKRLLRQRYEVAINSIVDVEQPPGHARLDRVQRIAGDHMLKLHQQCSRVGLDRTFDGATLAEGCMKSACGNLRCDPGHAYDRRSRRTGA